MDISHRGDFDAAVDKRFPNARRHRKEHHNGFEDTMNIGFLHVSLRVFPSGTSRKHPPNTLIVAISAIRTAVDGSVTKFLWRGDAAEWEPCLELLDELRAELLGIAHGLTYACGRGTPPPKKKPKVSPDDGLDLLNELFS